MQPANDNSLEKDVLYGAAAIASFLGVPRRVVYHQVAKGTLPSFRLGDVVCGRRSTILIWIVQQEAKGRAMKEAA